MLAVLAPVLAACGGGGGGSKSNAADSAFATQANALCAALAKDDAAGRTALGPTPTDEALATYVRGSFVPEAIGTFQQIGGLTLPPDQAEHLTTLMTDVIAEYKLLQTDPIKGGSKPHQRQLRADLAAVGLTECDVGFAPALDKAEFIAEAGPICLNVYTKIGDERRKRGISDTSSPETKVAFVSQIVVPLARDGLADLRTIGAPEGDEATINAILDDLDAEVKDITDDPTKFGVVDERHQRIQAAWRAYGVDNCALYTD